MEEQAQAFIIAYGDDSQNFLMNDKWDWIPAYKIVGWSKGLKPDARKALIALLEQGGKDYETCQLEK